MVILRDKIFSLFHINHDSLDRRMKFNTIGAVIAGVTNIIGNLLCESKRFSYSIRPEKIISYCKRTYKDLLIGGVPKVGGYYKENKDKNGTGFFVAENDEDKRDWELYKKDHKLIKEKEGLDIDNPKTEDDYLFKASIEKKDIIIYDPNANPIPTIAHEVGHYIFGHTEKGKNIQGKGYRKGVASKEFIGFIGAVLGISKISTYFTPIVSLILGKNTLYSEFMASYLGYNLLKDLGADKKDLRNVLLSLGGAFSTYLSGIPSYGLIGNTAYNVAAMHLFSEREKVSSVVARQGKRSGVIQKKPNGRWGIISYKTNPPEWWDADYKTREDAQHALNGYWANKKVK